MNDRELLYIKTIAETKSISKASEKLFVTQPSLSQSLQKIEDELGVSLFVRQSRGMNLTFAGEKYYLMAKEILNRYEDFKSEVTYLNQLKKGKLVIGTANFLGIEILSEILPKFNRLYPNIELYIVEENSTILEEKVLNGSIDLAIAHSHNDLKDKKITYEDLEKDEFVVISKKGGLSKFTRNGYVNLNDISDKFILLEKYKGIRTIQDIIFDRLNITPNIILTTKNFELAKRLVINGMGVSILPLSYLNIFKGDSYDFYRISNCDVNYWYVSILTAPDVYSSKVSSVFKDFVKDYFKNIKL